MDCYFNNSKSCCRDQWWPNLPTHRTGSVPQSPTAHLSTLLLSPTLKGGVYTLSYTAFIGKQKIMKTYWKCRTSFVQEMLQTIKYRMNCPRSVWLEKKCNKQVIYMLKGSLNLAHHGAFSTFAFRWHSLLVSSIFLDRGSSCVYTARQTSRSEE